MASAPDSMEGKLFSGGPVEVCRVEARRHALVATSATQELRFPYDRSRISHGGEDGAKLVVTLDLRGESHVLHLPREAALANIRSVADAAIVRRLDARERALHRSWLRPGPVTVGIVVMLVVAAAGVHLAANALVRTAVSRVPVAWETVLGRTIVNEEFPVSVVIDDPVINAAVDEILDRLLASADVGEYEIRVHVVDRPDVNAFALPGGEIVLLAGLIAAADRPEEVAGVLAHEIQHVLGRHGLQSVVESLRWQVLSTLVLGDQESTGEMLLAGSANFILLAHSRDHERDADREGIDLLDRADVNPRPMIDFYEKLEQLGAGFAVPEFLSTHPGGSERVDSLNRRLVELGRRPYEPFASDWQVVRDRAAELASTGYRSFP